MTFNPKQRHAVLSVLEENMDSESYAHDLLRVYNKVDGKGFTYYEKKKIDKMAELEVSNPEKLLFMTILLLKGKNGTLEQIAEFVKQPIERDDWSVYNDFLIDLRLPIVEQPDWEDTYLYYMNS